MATAVTFLLLTFMVYSVSSQNRACVAGWFGSSCQYKCRCVNNCNQDGQCTSGGCQGGWFGPACQYSDVAYNTEPTITDGDDGTCLTTSPPVNNITVVLKSTLIFTWMRIRVNKPGLHNQLTVKFGSLDCLNLRKASVDDTTLDIHCNLRETIQSVTLSGQGVQFLCSVYVSGGRNVALKQETHQSSNYTDGNRIFTSNLSVDGNTSGNFNRDKSCSCTKPHSRTGYWNVSFSLPQSVQRYVLYNRVGDNSDKLIGFTLESFGQANTKVFSYTDPNKSSQRMYQVPQNISVNSSISLVKITAKNNNFLQLCEVEVYGDSACNKGKYGRECKHDCNCNGGEACFISTGGCPSGCKAGFYGESCHLPCESGWVGSSCKYKCRCGSGNSCTVDGQCISRGCEGGWFGPACQYADLAYNRNTTITDGDDNTCFTSTLPGNNVTVGLMNQTSFTWLRVRVVNSDFLRQLTVTFNDGSLTCLNPSNANVDQLTLDIYCNVRELVQSVTLSGEGIQYLCSVYVSGGRNVALRQSTTQSSTYSESSQYFYSNLSVDGNTNGDFNAAKSCSHTVGYSDAHPNWNVSFPLPQRVQRFVLYNRVDGSEFRMIEFRLKSFDQDGAMVFSYTDNNPKSLPVYTVILPVTVTSTVSLVNIEANNSENILNMCEVEVYGDSACDKGKYGRKCEHDCNCDGGETCFISTGGCPSGCKAGFYGESCNLPCRPNTYGLGCGSNCSQFCVVKNVSEERSCDRVNGSCFSGCQSGYDGETCMSPCPPETYGLNCSQNCSHFCVKNTSDDRSCDHINGFCFRGCESGYDGEMCLSPCPPETYGLNCSQNCSHFCVRNTSDDRSCDHINGSCFRGCESGYEGEMCLSPCKEGTYGLRCGNNCSDFCVMNISGERSCDHVNGACLHGCENGYQGQDCKTMCTPETYGPKCSENCSQFCVRNTEKKGSCDHVNGTCLSGCMSGYEGTTCFLQSKGSSGGGDSNNGITGAVVGSIFGVIFAAVVIFAVIVFMRRRTKAKSKDGQSSPINNSKNESHSDLSGAVMNSPSDIEVVRREPSVKNASSANSGVKETEFKEPTRIYYNTITSQGSTVVPLEELEVFISSKDKEFFKNQFTNIPANQTATMDVGMSTENRLKNRYKNICAYDHSRVNLIPNVPKKHGDYINASYIEGYKSDEKFIASQGPTKTMLEDFVRMLWEQRVEKVVMLTNLIEEGKQKCEKYWPEDEEMKVGEVTVRLTTTQVYADYTIRRLQLRKESQSGHDLIHFHFTSWPDKDIPNAPWGLVDFEQRVASYPTSKPIVVHCSAGVGRTGTFIALRNVMRQAEETGSIDFFTTVQKLRQDRINMVQTVDQYIFLHRAAQVAMLCIGTTVTSKDIQTRIGKLQTKLPSGQTKMEKEFKSICSACDDKKEAQILEVNTSSIYENSQSVVNKLKNRDNSILPKEIYRVYLNAERPGLGDYINAVLVPSFSKQNHQILTQLPLPGTVADFWRLVTQYQINLIVAFDVDLGATDPTIADYLTPSDEATSSLFKINREPALDSMNWRQQKLVISLEKQENLKSPDHHVTHLTSTNTDLDMRTQLAFILHIKSLQQKVREGRTLYMCRDGATYSGLACVLSLLLDRMDSDQCLTVPLVVGTVKTIRPEVIPTLEQYKLLYDVLEFYSETMAEYSNIGNSKA